MTIGIYKLSFDSTSFVYIGQSENIEKRYVDHIGNMRNNNATYKLQAAYILFGKPSVEILVECSIEDLTKYELESIEIYASITNGLNILNGATPRAPLRTFIPINSKYTEDVYLNILLEIINKPILSSSTIAINTNTDTTTVTTLRNLTKHTWLKSRYPEEYVKLEKIHEKNIENSTRINDTPNIEISVIKTVTYYPTIVSPDNKEYLIEKGTASDFAKLHDLSYTQLNKVLNGRILHVKKWKLKI